jgi:hypothetical protein
MPVARAAMIILGCMGLGGSFSNAETLNMLPQNTLPCSDFMKQPDGTWLHVNHNEYSVCGANAMWNLPVTPEGPIYQCDNGKKYLLFDLLEAICKPNSVRQH